MIEQNPKKQKPELHVLNIMLIIKMSKHPIIDQRLKQKPDLRLREILVDYQQYHHSLQEKKHLGAKINQNMTILNRNTHLKENQVGHEIIKNQNQILKDHLLLNKKIKTTKTKSQNQQDPTMTPKRMRTEPEHIGEKQQKDI